MLKLSVPVTFGLHFLPDLLREFRKDYPDINFDVVLTDEPIDFVGSGRDIAVTFATNVTQSDSIVRRLSPAGVMLCATPEYLRDAGPLQAPTDLAAHHCISIAPQRTSSDVWQLQDLDGRSAAVSIKPAIVCNTIAMVHQCVFAHLGIGMFRWLYAKDLIADGRLIRVLPAFEVPGVDLVIAYPNRRYLTSKAQAFIDFLLSRMTAGGFASLTKHEAAADSLATTNQSSQWSENSSR
jgi:DNA-binding transcriptional LysR family regulator